MRGGVTANTGEVLAEAEEATPNALNGAQTQSLITVVQQFATGQITENQAINIISTAIGVSREKAKQILRK